MKDSGKELAVVPDPNDIPKVSVVSISAMQVSGQVRVARFRGRPMVLEEDPYPHFVPLHKERFDRIAYPILGGVSRSRMSDVFAYLGNTAEDLSVNDRYVLFGLGDSDSTVVWDMETLEFIDGVDHDSAIWRSPYGPVPRESKRLKFVMQLAGNDEGLYDDIMQSLAPLVMQKKPDGVIWWVGDGANGKSTLMDAIYKIFPGQLSSINVKRLSDSRDTPSLNGTLANIVKESSEGRIDDTEIYKSIGTHENFRVHKFHSQDDVEIRGNIHHIFSANAIPTFNDKGYSARRRTFIVPFTQRFESDPDFEDRTFTPEMFGSLVQEMCYYAQKIRDQGYKYKWSATTLAAKGEYDMDANNAEEYAKHIISEGVVAFDSFDPLRTDYENWCADESYVPLGAGNFRRAVLALGFDRVSHRGDGGIGKIYKLDNVRDVPLQALGMGRPGLYSTPGFQPEPTIEEKTAVPDFEEPIEEVEEVKPSILDGKW